MILRQRRSRRRKTTLKKDSFEVVTKWNLLLKEFSFSLMWSFFPVFLLKKTQKETRRVESLEQASSLQVKAVHLENEFLYKNFSRILQRLFNSWAAMLKARINSPKQIKECRLLSNEIDLSTKKRVYWSSCRLASESFTVWKLEKALKFVVKILTKLVIGWAIEVLLCFRHFTPFISTSIRKRACSKSSLKT